MATRTQHRRDRTPGTAAGPFAFQIVEKFENSGDLARAGDFTAFSGTYGSWASPIVVNPLANNIAFGRRIIPRGQQEDRQSSLAERNDVIRPQLPLKTPIDFIRSHSALWGGSWGFLDWRRDPSGGSGGQRGRFHFGVDLYQNAGFPVETPVNLRVVSVANDPAGGGGTHKLVLVEMMLQTNAGFESTGLYFRLLHLKDLEGDVRVGTVVQAGSRLGLIGELNGTTAPHLHLEVVRHTPGSGSFNPICTDDPFSVIDCSRFLYPTGDGRIGQIPDISTPRRGGGSFSPVAEVTANRSVALRAGTSEEIGLVTLIDVNGDPVPATVSAESSIGAGFTPALARQSGEGRRPSTPRQRFEVGGEIQRFRNQITAALQIKIEELYAVPPGAPSTNEQEFREWTRGQDPWMWDFAEKHKREGFDVFGAQGLNGQPFWSRTRAGHGKFTSLGRIFAFFCGVPLAARRASGSDGTHSEIQVMWHNFNRDAAWYASQPLCNFLINKDDLMTVLKELFSRSGSEIKIEALLNAISSNIIHNLGALSWGMSSLYESTGTRNNDRDVSGQVRESFRNNQAEFNNKLNEILARSYSRFGEVNSSSVRFVKPRVMLSVESVPVVGTNGDELGVSPIALLRMNDATNSQYEGLNRILQSSRNLSPPPSYVLTEQIDLEQVRTLEEARLISRQEDGSIVLVGGSDRLKRLYRRLMPTFVWGGEGSLVKSARFNNLDNQKLASIQMERNYNRTGITPSQSDASGIPLRTAPAQVSMELIGCPFVEMFQSVFIDFRSSSTVDNIYGISSVSHQLSAGKFTTSCKLIPLDAYGTYENQIGRMIQAIEAARRAGNDD
jgi:murein DD-endopeptidase MepM/ murein hydrolase activator NlpD